jgi:lipopolysaccharide/colanic/teichoic acid biosynthesis glycosyltransferase
VQPASSLWHRGGKRAFDIAAACGFGTLALPLIVASAGLLWVFDGRPLFFRQVRSGRFGRPFQILKLRTMRPGEGRSVTSAGDPRVTAVGRWLRRTKLDELPQLWNVLRGDMSLVGPRPEVPMYVGAQPRSFRAIADLRPGLTDWASLVFRDEESLLSTRAAVPFYYERHLLPRKLALARLYHRRMSPRLDVALVLASICLPLRLTGLVTGVLGERFVTRAWRGL